ncbi:MAG: radical SAM protein [Planctomycetes bacterium]|nr:radical SAM protein [Planctomycetota bacterium]
MSPSASFDPFWGFLTCDLEITNACGAGCAICPREAIRRPIGRMDAALFRTIADRLLAADARITLSGMGDPLAHPAWEAFIRSVRDRGGSLGIQVSAASLDPGAIARLVAARPSFINLSVPSIRPAVLARILTRRDPGDLIEAAERLVDACRDRVPVAIIGIRTALEPGEGMEEEFERFWKDRGVAARVFPCHSRGGNLRDPDVLATTAPPGLNAPCGLLARHAFVTWEGDLLACCHDLAGETRIGNLAREELAELAERKAKLAARVPPFDLCRRCDEALRLLPLPAGSPPRGRHARARYFRGIRRDPAAGSSGI